MAHRLRGRYGYPADEPFRVTFHPDRLEEPLHWRKPQRVFVCSMGDLFHEAVSCVWQWQVFATMRLMPEHTFLVLTKRPSVMHNFITDFDTPPKIERTLHQRGYCLADIDEWPLPNVWLGVTVEDQQRADERIPILLATPAAKRFVSCEPLLGPVDLSPYLASLVSTAPSPMNAYGLPGTTPALDHIIAGGESGPGARPTRVEWVQGLRDQCQAAGVPFFFKNWGSYWDKIAGVPAGHLLDGQEHREFPS